MNFAFDEMIAVFVLIAVGFLLRIAYLFTDTTIRDSDEFVHLNIIEDIRRCNHRVPDESSQSIVGGRLEYPPLMHLLLSYVPPKYLKTVARLAPGIVDVGFMAIIAGYGFVSGFHIEVILLSILIFVCLPQYNRFDTPHGRGLSARKLGIVLSTMSLVFLAGYTTTTTLFLLVPSVLFGGLVLLTSRFSTQYFVFTLLVLGTLYPVSWGVIFGSLIAALVLSLGAYRGILRCHLYFMYDYCVNKQYKFLYDGWMSRNTLESLYQARSLGDLFEALHDTIVLRGLVNHITILPAFWVLLNGGPTGVPELFGWWIVAGFGLFVTTSIYHLRFLGAGDRYLEHTTFPATIIIAVAFFQDGAWLSVIVPVAVIAGLCIIAVYIWAYTAFFGEDGEERAFDELVRYLRSVDPGTVIVQPRFKGAEIAWKTEHSVNDLLGNVPITTEVIEEWENLYPEKEGHVTENVDWLQKQYDPDWVIFDKRIDTKGLKPPDEEAVFNNEWYSVYTFGIFQ
jgi:hypothetical protein